MTTKLKKLHELTQRARRREINWFNPVPMIDIVFLLLVFFMLSANFRGDEGFLPAALPTMTAGQKPAELDPLLIYLSSRPDGSCQIQVGRIETFVVTPISESDGFELLSERLPQILAQQGRHLNDPIKLVPTWQTRWDDVVKAYNALWRVNLTNIIFAVVEPN